MDPRQLERARYFLERLAEDDIRTSELRPLDYCGDRYEVVSGPRRGATWDAIMDELRRSLGGSLEPVLRAIVERPGEAHRELAAELIAPPAPPPVRLPADWKPREPSSERVDLDAVLDALAKRR